MHYPVYIWEYAITAAKLNIDSPHVHWLVTWAKITAKRQIMVIQLVHYTALFSLTYVAWNMLIIVLNSLESQVSVQGILISMHLRPILQSKDKY